MNAGRAQQERYMGCMKTLGELAGFQPYIVHPSVISSSNDRPQNAHRAFHQERWRTLHIFLPVKNPPLRSPTTSDNHQRPTTVIWRPSDDHQRPPTFVCVLLPFMLDELCPVHCSDNVTAKWSEEPAPEEVSD